MTTVETLQNISIIKLADLVSHLINGVAQIFGRILLTEAAVAVRVIKTTVERGHIFGIGFAHDVTQDLQPMGTTACTSYRQTYSKQHNT